MIFYEAHRSNKKRYLYHELKENYSYGSHLHKSFEFACCLEGNLEITINQTPYMLSPGEAVLILPNQVHSYQTHGDKHFMCIFSCDYVDDFYKDMKGKTFAFSKFKMPGTEFVEGFQQAENSFMFQGLLYFICSQAYANCEAREVSTAQEDLMEKVIYYVQERFRENISLKTLAADLGYSYSYLSTFINNSFGSSFPYFLNMYRMEHAASLLLKKDMSITEVAGSCGFGSIRNFNRIFLEFYGKTPKEYIAANQDALATTDTLETVTSRLMEQKLRKA